MHRRPHSLGRHRSECMLSLVSGLVGGRGGAESLAVFAFQFVRDLLFNQVASVIEAVVRVAVDVSKRVPRTPHSFVRGHRRIDASGGHPRCVRGMDQVFTGARRALPRRGLRLLRGLQCCFGFSACSSPAGRTSGRLTFSFTSSGGTSGSSFVESHVRLVSHHRPGDHADPSCQCDPSFLAARLGLRRGSARTSACSTGCTECWPKRIRAASFATVVDLVLEIFPDRSVSPDWYCFGVRPR